MLFKGGSSPLGVDQAKRDCVKDLQAFMSHVLLEGQKKQGCAQSILRWSEDQVVDGKFLNRGADGEFVNDDQVVDSTFALFGDRVGDWKFVVVNKSIGRPTAHCMFELCRTQSTTHCGRFTTRIGRPAIRHCGAFSTTIDYTLWRFTTGNCTGANQIQTFRAEPRNQDGNWRVGCLGEPKFRGHR